MLFQHGYYAMAGGALLTNKLLVASGGIKGAAFIGVVCASLQMIGPDHLCTLMSLSSTISDIDAVKIGAAWGLAHCIGTIIVCLIFGCLRIWMIIDPEEWEHYGDYLIGFSLIGCGLYFYHTESNYIIEQSDGSTKIQGCDCHGLAVTAPSSAPASIKSIPPLHDMEDPPPPQPADDFFRRGRLKRVHSKSNFMKGIEEANKCQLHDGSETTPLVRKEASNGGGYMTGLALGLLQGICCPMVLVSVNCMAYVTTYYTTIVFLVTYAACSVFGAAAFSYAWARLIGSSVSKIMSPQQVYRFSCGFTTCFGIFWVLANAFNVLESLDYADELVKSSQIASVALQQ